MSAIPGLFTVIFIIFHICKTNKKLKKIHCNFINFLSNESEGSKVRKNGEGKSKNWWKLENKQRNRQKITRKNGCQLTNMYCYSIYVPKIDIHEKINKILQHPCNPQVFQLFLIYLPVFHPNTYVHSISLTIQFLFLS